MPLSSLHDPARSLPRRFSCVSLSLLSGFAVQRAGTDRRAQWSFACSENGSEAFCAGSKLYRDRKSKMSETLEIPIVGPKGGDLTRPDLHPSWRTQELNVETLPSGGPSLHRYEKPDVTVHGHKNEQVWHRMAALMLLSGRTNSEIAMAADVTPGCVSVLRSQKWFQELLATLANEVGQDVTGALKSYALEAVEGIHAIAVGAENERVQLSAYQLLLEHATGKPLQKTVSEISHSVNRSPSEEMQELQAELATLRNRTP